MLNQGPRPTFEDGRRTVEVNLLGFSGDLYDEWVKVEWVERLRDVQRFASPEKLQEQLQRDRERAQRALARAAPHPDPSRVSHA